MLGDLPDYDSRIKKRVLLFAVLLIGGLAFFIMQRHQRAHVRPSQEMKTGVKVLVDPESVVKDL
jgi:preprotein translocase subunit YajC